MNLTLTTLKAQDNALNSFLSDEDKVGDTLIATVNCMLYRERHNPRGSS